MIKFSRFQVGLLTVLLGLFCASIVLTSFLYNFKAPVVAFTSDDNVTSNSVVVGDIWNSSTKTFNRDTLGTLLKYISSDGTINGVNTNEQTAQDIRGYTYGGKTSGKSVVVTIGGYKWQVVYLTRRNEDGGDRNGDRIATLLMVNNDGTATISHGGYDNGSNWSNANPSNMYGASYMRAVTLNNGGTYANITANNSNSYSTATATQSSTHKYALYTVASQGLTQYLVQPKDVWYQTQSQGSGSDRNGTSYILNNESLATNITSGWYSNNPNTYSYQAKANYTQWGTDYLWLPSLSEAGVSDNAGIWKLSTTERSASSAWWSRSGLYNYSYYVYYLNSSGSGYNNYYVNFSYGVRPALHLNLDSAALSAAYTVNATTDASSTVNTPTFKYNLNSNEEVTLIFSPNPPGGAAIGSIAFNSNDIVISASEASVGSFAEFGDVCRYKCYRDENDNVVVILKEVRGDLTVSCTSQPLPISAVIEGGSANKSISFDFSTNDGELVITPAAGYYVYSALISGSGNTEQLINRWSDILYQQSSAFMVTYTASEYSNKVKFYFDEVSSDLTITITLTDIKPQLQQGGGANINGVVVNATSGGEVRVSGFDSSDDSAVVHLSAVPYKNYVFKGWVASDGTDLSAYQSSTEDIPYSLVKGKIITAQFEVQNASINGETNNQDDIR